MSPGTWPQITFHLLVMTPSSWSVDPHPCTRQSVERRQRTRVKVGPSMSLHCNSTALCCSYCMPVAAWPHNKPLSQHGAMRPGNGLLKQRCMCRGADWASESHGIHRAAGVQILRNIHTHVPFWYQQSLILILTCSH